VTAAQPHPAIRAAVLTASDRCARGESTDISGPAIAEMLRTRLGAQVIATLCLLDDLEALAAQFAAWSRPDAKIDLIVSTGGTGLSPRDVTPEAAMRVIDRPHQSLMELARMRCYSTTPKAYLSRGVSGAANQTLILTLPGSPQGACDQLEALLDVLPHALEVLRGGGPH